MDEGTGRSFDRHDRDRGAARMQSKMTRAGVVAVEGKQVDMTGSGQKHRDRPPV